MKQQGELLAARQPSPLKLATELDSPPLSRHYSTPEVILGREPSCAFPINDQTVSSHHARLSFHQNQWWLEDLASTNGTYLNGTPVTAAVVITNGDLLRMGQVEVRVTIG
jgi:pSer/pThr/pTyr-binding forkhead associated (FHA) protein